ncbi:hypothetical protein [Variovorax sp. PCZ-1]|uniref:hypothetical protein n=1 Tax=Variovorax sp. PCZ-1 TaxID=2835533 RepID=UPI001BCEB160|nr:hypothetical protein [Variovorax sp. PCZ-1]MBS7806784.1 hypothetical protein [Variovorax sp. PCZ-1]
MNRMRGWGFLLAIGVPLLIFFSWSRLGSQTSRINLERYENQGPGDSLQMLSAHFKKTRQLPVAGNFTLPPIPPKSGIKAWSVQPDGVFKIEIDAKIDGQAVVLLHVPVVGKNGVIYDCVSTVSRAYVRKFCLEESVKSVADIPAQLQANTVALNNLPPVIAATGEVLASGVLTGSAFVAQGDENTLNNCGYNCVKPLSCANERPLLCSKIMDQNHVRFLELRPSGSNHRAINLQSESLASQACEQSLGTGWAIARAGDLGAKGKAALSGEYWLHDDRDKERNCWRS